MKSKNSGGSLAFFLVIYSLWQFFLVFHSDASLWGLFLGTEVQVSKFFLARNLRLARIKAEMISVKSIVGIQKFSSAAQNMTNKSARPKIAFEIRIISR